MGDDDDEEEVAGRERLYLFLDFTSIIGSAQCDYSSNAGPFLYSFIAVCYTRRYIRTFDFLFCFRILYLLYYIIYIIYIFFLKIKIILFLKNKIKNKK